MSERMTNEETRRFIDAVNNINALGGAVVHMPLHVMTKVAQEISAGRMSEVQKDIVIKALADALEHLHSRVMLSAQSAALVAKALRLAGRLP